MAAGRRGGFGDHELREREFVVEVSRKKELFHEQFRDVDRSGRDSRGRDAVRARNRGARERELVNGSRRSSSSASDSSGGSMNRGDQGRRQVSGRSADREPGELSSGSDDLDSQRVRRARDNGVQGLANGVMSSPTRKRKFSPIVWDRDDGKKSDAAPSRSNVDPVGNGPLPPPPPLPEGFLLSDSVVMVRSLEHSSPAHSKSSPALRTDELESNDREPGQLEEDDDFVPARNISSSRWADINDAYEENKTEGVAEESTAKRRKGTPIENSVVPRLYKKTPTSPELGEFTMREGSEGASSRSSDSGSEGGDAYQAFESGTKDYMDIDGDDSGRDIIDHQSDNGSESEDDIIKSPSPAQPPQRCINMLQGCRSVDEFERLNKIDEGTYGVVYRARDKKTGEVVALKKVKMEKEREGFPMTSLREINILLSFHHPSIVDVKEVVVGSSLDSIFMVMEYMEHDLKGLMESMKQPFSQSEVKCLVLQLILGVKYLHDNWVLHRDLKTSNLLFNNRGELKICDFGLSRQYGSPLKPYTHLVVTLWYRAPELLLGMREYSTAIDMWSLGCIMAELLAKEPLFNGKTEFDQLDKIFRILGTPNEKIWPGFSKLPGVKINFVKQPYNKLREKFPPTSFSGRPTLSEKGFDLLNKLLTYDPEKRITAEAALKHEWFTEVPLPKSKDFMPTFPAQHAQDRRLRRILKSPDPLEEQRRKELQQGEIGTGSLFG